MVRAALARGAAWPRSGPALARLVAETAGRDPDQARWEPHPEVALVAALRRPGLVLAAPAWGVAAFAESLADLDIRWMPPAPGRLDPGVEQVTAALDAGANAVLLAPVAGDCAAIHPVAQLCAERGVPFALDARMASGGRVLDGAPGAWGDPVLLAVHGEPGPAPCPGAVLVSSAHVAPVANGVASASTLGHGLALLRDAVRAEPRLRRLVRRRSDTVRSAQEGDAPDWAFAAAAARLQQSADRASQRARHGKTLRSNIAHVEGITVLEEPIGVQSASCVLPLLAENRDAVADALTNAGIPTLQMLGGWLAPERARPATDVPERALLLPLHPFYRPDDLVRIGETLRRAALGALEP